jgi:serpin B
MQRRVVLISALAVVAVGLGIGIPVAVTSGGNSPSSPASEPAQPLAGARIAARVGAAYELVAARTSQPSTTGDPNALAGAEQKFSLALLRQLSDPDKNVTVSPASLGLALAMLEHGAAGSTLSQIQQALQTAGMSPDEQGAAWAALVKAWDGPSSGVELHAANSIWEQKGFQPSAQFLEALHQYYSAGIWQADFSNDNAAATKAINDWVAQHTNGRIPSLFDRLPQDTRAVLANALYFKANWQSPFDPQDSAPGQFTTRSGTVTTPFMQAQTLMSVAHTDKCTAVELPYKGGRFAALAIMPKSGSLGDFVSGMSTSELSSIVSGLQRQQIDLRLPKFKTTATLDLKAALAKLGMTTAFTDGADFSKMSGESLKVGAVVQRDFLSVTEKGTEAAAATGVVMEPTMGTLPAPTVTFDRPFLFLVRDVQTGAILFASQIQNPAAG